MSIEGIPDGWGFVRVGRVFNGEHWVNNYGQPTRWDSDHASTSANYVIIRKIEKPKQFRPFANAAEFLTHHLSGDYIDVGAGEFAKVQHCSDSGIWFSGDEDIQLYADAIADLKFRDGTTFGVEVTE